MMNQCHFLGNFVRDPELRDTPSGKKVLNFTLGINRRYKRGKETVKEPCFIDCEAWDTGAETLAKYCHKGDPIIVHCSVKQESWEDKATGQKRTKLKFRVNQFDFIPGGNKRNGEGEPEPTDADAEPETVAAGAAEGDIPF